MLKFNILSLQKSGNFFTIPQDSQTFHLREFFFPWGKDSHERRKIKRLRDKRRRPAIRSSFFSAGTLEPFRAIFTVELLF
jgi:hypothetical protein